MKKLGILAFIVLVASCKSKKPTIDSSERFVIENLAQVATNEKLNEVYPDAAIEIGVDERLESSENRPYTILFPGTANEALIMWKDMQKNNLYGIKISNNGQWTTKNGIEIGTSYRELIRLNRGPISFYGFGWDYGGAVDWKGGKLENSNIQVFLAPKETAPNKFYGDKIIQATGEELQALQLSVQSILYKEAK